MSLKSSKVNEKILRDETDHLRALADDFERVKVPAQEKEIGSLKLTIENVILDSLLIQIDE